MPDVLALRRQARLRADQMRDNRLGPALGDAAPTEVPPGRTIGRHVVMYPSRRVVQDDTRGVALSGADAELRLLASDGHPPDPPERGVESVDALQRVTPE